MFPPTTTDASSTPDLDTLLANAKASLARSASLEDLLNRAGSTVPSNAFVSSPDSDIHGPTSLIGALTWSPIPAEAASSFANTVDPDAARDREALQGTYGAGDELKSFLAGAGSGVLNLIRSANTPAGLAGLAAGGGGVGGRIAGAVASLPQLLNGGAKALDPSASLGARAAGIGEAGVGALGAALPWAYQEDAGDPALADLADRISAQGQAYGGGRGTTPGAAPAPSSAPTGGSTDLVPYTYRTVEGSLDAPADVVEGSIVHPTATEGEILPNTEPETPEAVDVAAPTSPPAAPAPSSSTPSPFFTSDDLPGLLAGRAKFAEQYPGVDLGAIGDHPLDQMGAEYARTQSALKDLLGMGDDADPTEVAQMNQGARELGSRLRSAAKGYGSPPPPPPVEPTSAPSADVSAPAAFTLPKASPANEAFYDTFLQKLATAAGAKPPEMGGIVPSLGSGAAMETDADPFSAEYPFDPTGERGAVDPALATQLGGHAAGALVGSLAGNTLADDDHKTRDTILGAILGGLGGGAIANPELLDTLAKTRVLSMLTNPTTLAKKGLGDTGAVLAEAFEGGGAPGHAGNVLGQYFNPETLSVLKDSFLHPEQGADSLATQAAGSTFGSVGNGLQKILGLPSRAMGAMTDATQDALFRAGISPKTAQDLTYLGTPSNKTLADIARIPASGPLGSVLMPFARTGTNILNKGMERTPLEALRAIPGLGDLSGDPAAASRAIRRAIVGTGALGAGYALEPGNDSVHPAARSTLAKLLTAAAGPAGLEMAGGQFLKDATTRDTSVSNALDGLWTALGQEIPLPAVPRRPGDLPAELVPNAVADLAQYLDPTKRSTSADWLDPVAARLPGLRQQLDASRR